jgi:ankyrin repeat protein
MFNQPQMARWLLSHGAQPNPKYDGKTPLALPLANNLEELVEVLRSYGGVE